MTKIIFIAAVVSVSLLLMSNSSCGREKKRDAEEVKQDSTRTVQVADSLAEKMMEKNGFVKATVINNTGLDGCRFMLQLEDGKRLEPLNLEEKYLKDGLKVWVKYKAQKDAMSVCMAGDIVSISEIEKR